MHDPRLLLCKNSARIDPTFEDEFHSDKISIKLLKIRQKQNNQVPRSFESILAKDLSKIKKNDRSDDFDDTYNSKFKINQMYPLKLNSNIHLKSNKEFGDENFDMSIFKSSNVSKNKRERWHEFKRNQSLSKLIYENTEESSPVLKDRYKLKFKRMIDSFADSSYPILESDLLKANKLKSVNSEENINKSNIVKLKPQQSESYISNKQFKSSREIQKI